jgi:DNA ligase-1
LTKREITGDRAKLEIAMSCATPDKTVNKWLKAMWEKKPRIGVSTISVNKVFPGLIPKFSLQLCEKIDPATVIGEGWVLQPKYDGLRCVMIVEDHKFKGALSRSGRELFNIEHIGLELAKAVKEGVFDGEIYGDDWNETSSIVKASKATKFSKSIKFYAFDLIPMSEWRSRSGQEPLKARLDSLSRVLKDKIPYVSIVPSYHVKTTKEAWDVAKDFNKDGYEGAVAKRLDRPYVFDRSKEWVKMKFIETYDVKIVGYEEGQGKYEGLLGAFVCEMPVFGIGKTTTIVKVGGGYTDVLREEFWKVRNKMIGKIIECQCQELTKDGVPRFPVFVRVRDDK